MGKMNPDFQVYAKILKFALIYRNEEGCVELGKWFGDH